MRTGTFVLALLSLVGSAGSVVGRDEVSPRHAPFEADAERAARAVVTVEAERKVRPAQEGVLAKDSPWRRWLPVAPLVQCVRYEPAGAAAGFLVTGDGAVITRLRAVADADRFRVTLADGRAFEADLAATDPEADLALLRLRGAEDLPHLTLGESATLLPGSWVLALGASAGPKPNVTVGVVTRRADVIRTLGALHAGNIGGPLLDARGRVVGVSGGGCAAPVERVRDLLANR